MKTVKESFIDYNPTAKDWDKFDWEITNFNADYMLAFAEHFADQQNKELREKHEKQIADWKREEKMWGEHELHYKAEIERLKERNKYLEEHSNKRFEQANELNDKDQEIQRLTEDLQQARNSAEIAANLHGEKVNEIQRLTKEVEEYKVVVKNYDKIGSEKTETITSLRDENGELESKNIALEQAVDAFNYEIIKRDGIIKENARISELMSSDIQRLRELLGRAKEYIPFVRINGEPERHTSDCKYPYSKCKCHLEELLTEIDNETDGKDN